MIWTETFPSSGPPTPGAAFFTATKQKAEGMSKDGSWKKGEKKNVTGRSFCLRFQNNDVPVLFVQALYV
jgi:hypothetical protein